MKSFCFTCGMRGCDWSGGADPVRSRGGLFETLETCVRRSECCGCHCPLGLVITVMGVWNSRHSSCNGRRSPASFRPPPSSLLLVLLTSADLGD